MSNDMIADGSKRRLYVGIDTSNYTTSCALFDAENRCFLSNVKRLLTVGSGERGLRQSDAVFSHVKNLPDVLSEGLIELDPSRLSAVGVSVSPRDSEGSYMPCFLVGEAAASALAEGSKRPLYRFSHQAGHIMAAIWSSKSPDLLRRDFISFHVSGGTTELLYVKPETEKSFSLNITKLGGTLDLNAGQAIDRCGVAMGLDFPCGAKLEPLAEEFYAGGGRLKDRAAVSVRGCQCNLSGIENKVQKLLAGGAEKGYVSAYLFDFIGRTLTALAINALAGRELPVLFAGGVMSNRLIKNMLKKESFDSRFAEPVFSSDNAAGTALLTALCEEGDRFWIK